MMRCRLKHMHGEFDLGNHNLGSLVADIDHAGSTSTALVHEDNVEFLFHVMEIVCGPSLPQPELLIPAA
jgi:hypothetical protein